MQSNRLRGRATLPRRLRRPRGADATVKADATVRADATVKADATARAGATVRTDAAREHPRERLRQNNSGLINNAHRDSLFVEVAADEVHGLSPCVEA